MSFAVGDRVWYVLNRAPDRPRPVLVDAVVIHVGDRLIGIQMIDASRPRYVRPSSLTIEIPAADVEIVTTLRRADLEYLR